MSDRKVDATGYRPGGPTGPTGVPPRVLGPFTQGVPLTADSLNGAIASRAAAEHGHTVSVDNPEPPRIVYAVYWLAAIALTLTLPILAMIITYVAWIALTTGLPRP